MAKFAIKPHFPTPLVLTWVCSGIVLSLLLVYVVFKNYRHVSTASEISIAGLQSFSSSNSLVTYYLKPIPNLSEKCSLLIKNSSGRIFDATKVLNIPSIDCIDSPVGFYSPSIRGWINDNELVIGVADGRLILFNTDTSKSTSLEYDKNYRYVTTNKTGSVFLYLSNVPNEVIISGRQFSPSNKISFSKDSDVGYEVYEEMYDQVNDGFIITLRKNVSKNNKDYMNVKIYFYNIENNKLSLVLNSGDTALGNIFQYSCQPSQSVSSSVGEILIKGSCLIVEKKYINGNGLIKIDL